MLIRNTSATDFEAAFLPKISAAACSVSTNGWGYGVDTLNVDLSIWRTSPAIRVDSIGASVQNRPIYLVTAGGDGPNAVFIHARTHPREVQSSYIVREMMAYLLSGEGGALLEEFTFYIIPMLNPDGVEMGCARENAAGADLESSFFKTPMEPETKALKGQILRVMESTAPIRVALNLHASVNLCTRFFFFHTAGGTSEEYEILERDFIGRVQDNFFMGIESWDFMLSWQTGNPMVYPESFFWAEYGENVMALTYEDSNCPGAGDFDMTARALILGSVEYIQANPERLETISPASVLSGLGSPAFVAQRGKWLVYLKSGRRADLQGREIGR